ncbi:MAG: hypothetical protein ACKVT2_22885 [Saprospiraceae bacterium]
MKKSTFHKILPIAFLWMFACAQVAAQTNVPMAANGNTGTFSIAPPADCFFNFLDNGGAAFNYNNGANASVTFLPSNSVTHRIQVRFNSFGLEAGYDAFYIYNSNAVGVNKVNGPQGPTFSGFPGGNWQTISPGVLTANTGIAAVGANAAEALTFQFRSDNSISMAGWTAIVSQIPKIACAMTVPNNLNAFTGPLSTNCYVDVISNLPTFAGGCNAGYQVQYRINGGVAIPVPAGPGNTIIQAPVGNNVITWELVDPCGGGTITSGIQLIQVQDNTSPKLTCPSNITINLAPGFCEAINYTYSVTCTDNCMFPNNNNGQVNHPIDFNGGQAGIMFDVTNLSSNLITLTEFGPSLDLGAWPMEVYYTTNIGSFLGFENNPAAWTLAGKNTINSGGSGSGTPIPGYGITIPAGQTRGIYITSTAGAPINFTNGARQQADANLRVSSNPGSGKAYPFGVSFANKSYNGYVKYSIPVPNGAVQMSGIPSGQKYPIGTTTNVFECTDGVNTTSCSWTVTVIGFQPLNEVMTCNDLVNLALGPECIGELTADQVLEGGPYKCFDYYLVQVDKTLPYGNGPWVPAVFDCTDIGKTYPVRVTDDKNGNGNLDPSENKCFGSVKLFDDFPPQLDCSPDPITIPFNFPLDPLFSQVATMQLPFKGQGLPVNVSIGQTREFQFPVNLPMNATVDDVELRVKISGDALSANLHIEIESPSSTTVTTWNGSPAAGCGAAPLFVRFDDEGTPVIDCANFTTDKNAKIPFGFGVLNSFDNEPVNGIWKIRISDNGPFVDISKIEIADLYITMTGIFGAGFPNGLSPGQVVPNGFQSYVVDKIDAASSNLDFCSNVTLSYVDQTQNQNCTTGLSAIVIRRWMAKDASGNTSTCNETILLLNPSLADVVFPPDYDGLEQPYFKCTIGEYPTPEWIENEGFQGLPQVFGLPIGGNIVWEHHDTPIWSCDGSFSISRLWVAVDACTGKILTHTQLIQVVDNEGPVFITQPPAMFVSTDPNTCCSSLNLPEVLLMDSCSQISKLEAWITTFDLNGGFNIIPVNGGLYNFPGNQPFHPDTLGAFNLTPCIPIGEHFVTYIAEDDCGNTSSITFNLTVADYIPPVAACDETTIVAIGNDDLTDCYYKNIGTCAFAGVSWVKATTFDDGSYDECSPIKFTVRRTAPYSDCINQLDHLPCAGNAGNVSEFELATGEADSIKFYCCEVGTEQMIILRVYQCNIDGSISTYPDGTPIYNECQVKVQVQDKLKPVCVSPFNVTVNCENFDPSLWTYGKPSVYDNCCLDLAYEYQGQKGLTHSVSYNNFDTVCNKGTIMRTFRAYDCHGASSQCTQRIIVNYDQNYFIKFPNDVIVTSCNGANLFGEPIFFGEDCELLGVSFQDQVFTVVPDACFKIERTWTIINWCTYNANLGCKDVPNPNPNPQVNHASNLPGPTVSAPGTPFPWASTVVKINPGDQSSTNYSTFWEKNANCYRYKQIIKIIDTQAPIIVCPPSPEEFCDLTDNNPQLWNESYWWDPVNQSNDLCEAPVDLNISATDFCSGSNLTIRYLLFLDTNADGIMETVVSSTSPPAAGTVNFNNLNTPNFSGGTPYQFDKRAVGANQKYRFALQTTQNGTSLGGAVRWNTPGSPATYSMPELPYGTHKIKWIAADGCGNETVCEYTFVVKDCKAPSITCQNGLSGNLMQTGMITLYASDFLLHAVDNCTPADDLLFALKKCNNPVAGFPVDNNNNPVISLTFDCSELGLQCVELWAQDAQGNADFCETFMLVQDNAGNCGAGAATVAGLLKTEMNDGLEETDVELVGPSFNLFATTDQSGHYEFANAVPMHADYTLTPTKDDNPLNGVTTYDLVLISKHILGIEPLNSPYKMIAADANASGSITTFDIVELRKLILGIYADLPSNDSWRFVDKSFVFPNNANPFETAFPENKTVAEIQANAMEDNFVAIKVGDVNATAIANAQMSAEERSNSTLLFDLEDRTVKAGEVFEVKFKASEKVAGYQFTLNYNDLGLVDIIPGPGMKSDNFATFASENALTTSFDGKHQAEFTLKFKANKAGELNKMIGVSSRITKAEGYQANESEPIKVNRMDVALRFNGKDGSTISGVGFELYQNQPNPFVNRTMVGFHLPEASSAALSVFDQSGRLMFSQKGEFPKGYNTIPLEKALLNTSGALYYTLETSTDSATKTMIQAK